MYFGADVAVIVANTEARVVEPLHGVVHVQAVARLGRGLRRASAYEPASPSADARFSASNVLPVPGSPRTSSGRPSATATLTECRSSSEAM